MIDDEVGHTNQEITWDGLKNRTYRLIYDRREADARGAVVAFVILFILGILVACLGEHWKESKWWAPYSTCFLPRWLFERGEEGEKGMKRLMEVMDIVLVKAEQPSCQQVRNVDLEKG